MPRWVRAGKVLELARRPVDIDPVAEYQEIGLRSFGRGIFHKTPVAGVTLGTKRVFYIHSNDLLISNVFAWEGAIAVASESESGLIGSHRFMSWIPRREDEIEPAYVAEYLLSDSGLNQVIAASPGSAGRNRTLGIKAFEDLLIPLPDIDKQRSIANRLDRARSIGSITKRQINGTIGMALREQIFDSIQNFSTFRLGQLVQQDNSKKFVQPNLLYPNIGLLNHGRGVFEKTAIKGNETKASHLHAVQGGQLIYSKLFGWEGSVAVVPDNFDGYHVSSEFPHFDVDRHTLDLNYLRHAIRTRKFGEQLAAATTGMGQRRQRVNVHQFLNLLITVPSIGEQIQVAQRLDQVDEIASLADAQGRIVEALPIAIRNEVFSHFTR